MALTSATAFASSSFIVCRVEIGAHFAEYVLFSCLFEIGKHDRLSIGVGVRAAQAELFRGPGAQKLVPARVRLELKLLIKRKLLLETLFALIKGRHVSASQTRGSGTARRRRLWP